MRVVAVSIDSGRVLWVTGTLVESSCLADAYCLPDRIHHAVVDGYPLTALDRKVLQIGLKELGLPHGDDAAIGHSVGRLNVSFVPRHAIRKLEHLTDSGRLDDDDSVIWDGENWVEFDGKAPHVSVIEDVKNVNVGHLRNRSVESDSKNADNSGKLTCFSLDQTILMLWESGLRGEELFAHAKRLINTSGLDLPDHKIKVRLYILKKQKEG